ncbi:MAG: L-lactate dehydrogenase [Patescibacteria group bacterium]|nr:L-lactate dehydrogenase [Patescibacteria group bacterium]
MSSREGVAEKIIRDCAIIQIMTNQKLKNKIVVIGAGAVGSTIAYSLMIKNLTSDITLVDVNKEREQGEVMDISDALSFSETSTINAGDYDSVKDADIIILTAGAAQKDGESRLDLITKNKNIVNSIFKEIKEIKKSAIILVVSNPVDILTYLVQEIVDLPHNQVFGTGTALDSARLRSNLSKRFNIDSHQIEGFVLGEHGDSEFIAWSTVSIGGKPITEMLNKEEMTKICDEVKNEVYEIIKEKGATYYGIGMTVVDIVEALMLDQNKILPVTYRLNDYNGVSDVCLGSTAVVGSSGIIRPWLIELNQEEKEKFQESAKKIKEYL